LTKREQVREALIASRATLWRSDGVVVGASAAAPECGEKKRRATMSKGLTLEFRAFLELKDGRFSPTEEILLSPALQEQCKEKAVLRRIQANLRKRGLACVRTEDGFELTPFH
jgi:hypothetical protein